MPTFVWTFWMVFSRAVTHLLCWWFNQESFILISTLAATYLCHWLCRKQIRCIWIRGGVAPERLRHLWVSICSTSVCNSVQSLLQHLFHQTFWMKLNVHLGLWSMGIHFNNCSKYAVTACNTFDELKVRNTKEKSKAVLTVRTLYCSSWNLFVRSVFRARLCLPAVCLSSGWMVCPQIATLYELCWLLVCSDCGHLINVF